MIESFETLPFLRGVNASKPTDRPYISAVRAGRKPRDTPMEIHLAADAWFFSRFGVSFRSNAVFVSSAPVVAVGYAGSAQHIVRVLPLTSYQFCWSRKYSDALTIFKGIARPEDVPRVLEGAEYVSTDLSAAHRSGHELMLHCAHYLSIPVDLLNTAPAAAAANNSIILSV
jgi:hypothetical protein